MYVLIFILGIFMFSSAYDASNGFTTRFPGFYLYVSNSTDKLQGYLCFHDKNYTTTTIPAVINISCPVHGQYVIYYNERPVKDNRTGLSTNAFVELCEVEVYGCSVPRRYGPSCSKPCPTNCDEYCHIESGDCLQCKPGYKGPRCEQKCTSGFFGVQCEEICGNCLNFNRCHHINGTCLSGCEKGYEGHYCNTTCREGYFGEDCVSKCNETCKGCNRTNGLCDSGCQPGWEGDYCHEACTEEYFGEDCMEECNTTCNGCNKTNGVCEYGCHPGWKGTYCHKECDGGYFGLNCYTKCGNCLNLEQCHPVNGTCMHGCDAGFEGLLCNKTCEDGKFGENCLNVCNSTCYGCNRTNGVCENGCHPGWKGHYCHEVCDEGTFGRNCMENCNSTCYGCNRINGTCETGCHPGWKGDYCHKECDGGFFGTECIKPCGSCLDFGQCHPINGTCLFGCDAGFEGVLCNKTCRNGTFGRNCLETCNSTCYGCNATNGKCETGCQTGWKGDYCHEECDNGFYGADCSDFCGNCLDSEQCHPVDGTCINGCDDGFRGTLCNKTCKNGTFGRNCLEKCNSTCYGCNGTNGKCENGCFPGWKGEYCHEACTMGAFGRNCLETCNSTCYGCNTTNGKCETGCHPGWKGDYCHIECGGGYFGKNCKMKCGHCLNDAQCYHVNGSCLNGCAPGYNGTQCTEVCSKGFFGLNCVQECYFCTESTCWSHNGTCVLGLKQALEEDSSQIVGGAVGAVVFVLVVAMALILFIFVRRRYRKPDTQRKNSRLLPENTGEHQINNVYTNSNAVHELRKKGGQTYNSADELKMEQLIPNGEEKEDIRGDMDDLYVNQLSFSQISIDQLGAVIAEKSENENEGFRKEYTAFPSGAIHKCDEGKRTENVPKNRFKTTFPYDHSRVILRRQDENLSDYINANYIDGPNRKKEYIAAQGPKQNTLGDFWAMLWQENITTVVMLTNLREGEKIKCTQYWPDKDKHINYGTVSVKWMEEREYAFFVTRKLKVINKEMKKSRVLTHYHYTAWPDHGTPDPLCLIIFHNHVIRTQSNQKNAPTVVHCSAGVGRTGTYIALDILHQMGTKTGKVNVAECVRKMRENRMTMVQTYEQYITIFLTLQEDFKAPMKVDSIENIKEKIENTGKDTPMNQDILRKEFQLLHKISPVYTEADYKFSKQSSAHKNNDDEILPLDKYNVHLSSYVPKRGSYINAISVPSFTKPTGFIVTSYPATEDAVDFLRLLNDHECDTVICMDPLAGIQSTKEWFPPTSSSKFVPPFMVYSQSHSKTDVSSSTIQIVHDKKEDEAHIVRIVEPTDRIKSSGDLLDTSQLRNLVSAALNTDSENPIVVMSRDGASLCGIFCAIHNVLEQITLDECADIFTAVRQILIRRPELCTKIEEYKLIYKAVNDHLQSSSENIYFNQ
ncbi:uncharacterized protein LOC134238932 isoform X2 [Saccostrea cucullata]|uniref:uncharacterized protein LOC134238932 isoform X2 n=1 Tax=Saccostrea cuccullata TaxID=36930 RepID=UPI002ED079EE